MLSVREYWQTFNLQIQCKYFQTSFYVLWLFVILSFLRDPILFSYSWPGQDCSRSRENVAGNWGSQDGAESREGDCGPSSSDDIIFTLLQRASTNRIAGRESYKGASPGTLKLRVMDNADTSLSLDNTLRSTTEPDVSMFIWARRGWTARGARTPSPWSTSWTPWRAPPTSRRTTGRRMSSRGPLSRTLIKLSTSKYWNLILQQTESYFSDGSEPDQTEESGGGCLGQRHQGSWRLHGRGKSDGTVESDHRNVFWPQVDLNTCSSSDIYRAATSPTFRRCGGSSEAESSGE